MLVDEKIPKRYFLFWSGQNFKYVNYLTVLSLLNTNDVEICDVYYEEMPIGNPYWDNLKDFSNVRLVKLDYDHLISAAGVKKEDFNNFFRKAKINHKSDLFRYLVLYAFGGVYLDFDILLIKDLTPLLNTEFFVGIQNPYEKISPLNSAVMGSIKHSKVLMSCIKSVFKIANKEREFSWACLGPGLITHQICLFRIDFCIIRFVVRALLKFNFAYRKLVLFLYSLCTGRRAFISIYPQTFFYHYSWLEWEKIFQKNIPPDDAYLIHFWEYFAGAFVTKIDGYYIDNDDSLYSILVKKMMINDKQHKT